MKIAHVVPSSGVLTSNGDRLVYAAKIGVIVALVWSIIDSELGVILNLGVFFAWHVLWPQGFGGPFDGFSALIAAAAVVALAKSSRT